MNERVTLALPSKGAIADPTTRFLHECGLRVDKPNPRQYTGSIPALPCVDVLFQRVTGIVLQSNGNNYVPIFMICGSAYVTALLIIHLLVPRVERVSVSALEA